MFRNDERSNRLRPAILTDVVGQYMNDQERAVLYGLSDTVRMRERAKIISPELAKIGECVYIGENVLLDASGGLEIGEHTSLSGNVQVLTHTSWLNNMTLNNRTGSDLIERKPVKIGKGCFIAGGVFIMPGVTVGDFVTVQPNSVITKDMPDYSLVAGNPARVFLTYTEEHFQKEAERVRADNARRRAEAENAGPENAG
ncbi:MAG TPA: acyltransferase [Pseudonocardiaceae bacterium]|nr:acyltransferase [Pseudonocardiaceae bacterium]